jgi:zinc transporter ZupT
MFVALLLTAIAIGGIAIGVVVGRTRGLPPRVAAAGGVLLFGISLFWMLPEMAEQAGWVTGTLALTLGVVVLWCIDRFVYPICPSCSHTHDHGHCGRPPLHGFAAPLLVATGVHSLLDGWSIRLLAGHGIAGLAAPLGLALHKIPEGIALGLLVRESMRSTGRAFLACVAVECLTLVGAWIEPRADAAGALRFGVFWITGILALIAGSFLFLGFHTVHGSRKKSGVLSTFVLAIVAVACAALVHHRFPGL